MIRKYLMCGALLAFFTASAFGATITYDVTTSVYTTGQSGNFALTKFDSNLGTLNSVSWELIATASGGYYWIDNTTAINNGRFRISFEADVTVTAPDAVEVLLVPLQSSGNFRNIYANSDAGASDYIGTDAYRLNGADSYSDTQFGDITGAGMLAYIGTGNLLYTFDSANYQSSSFQNIGAGDLDTADQAPTFTITASVTYDYNPTDPPQVPEPGTLGMAAVLGSLALARLRRSRRANR